MKCQGNFVFKSIEHVDAGEFKNASGDIIKYPASYRLFVDEVQADGKINDIKFKIPETSADLINDLRLLKPYQNITLICNVSFYSNSVRVIPEQLQKIDK